MYNYTSVHVFQWLLGFIAVVVDRDSKNQHWDKFLFFKIIILGFWSGRWSRLAIWLGSKEFQVMELDCKVFLGNFSEKGTI